MIDKIGVHHSGPIGADPKTSSKHLTLEHIDRAHKARWPDFISELGYYVGYNAVIFPDGRVIQTRKLGEETAAAIGHNFDTFHICLVGNFNVGVDNVTPEAQNSLIRLVRSLLDGTHTMKVKEGTKYTFSKERIYPHRVLHPKHTDCFGTSLANSWVQDLLAIEEKPKVVDVVPPVVKPVEKEEVIGFLEQIIILIVAFINRLSQSTMKVAGFGRDDKEVYYSPFDK